MMGKIYKLDEDW